MIKTHVEFNSFFRDLVLGIRVSEPMGGDEGRKCWILLAMKIKARTVLMVGRGKKILLSDPGSELCLGTEKEKDKERR